MKHIFLKSSIVLIFFLMLVRPQEVFLGTKAGLLLWFETVLPTLLPFILISNLLIRTNAFSYLTFFLGPLIEKMLGTTEAGSFAVLTGFLCGYPMGAKTTADLIRSEHITVQEGSYLLSFCNNTSLGFIMNYIFLNILGQKDLMLPGIIILTLSPLLVSIPFRHYYYHKYHIRKFTSPAQHTHSKTTIRLGFDVLDTCIMDSFEAITNIGGYIMIFSVFIALMTSFLPETAVHPAFALPFSGIRCIFLPSLEITNGILLLSKTFRDLRILFPAVCALSSFGGFCAAAQTSCMIQDTGLKLFPYTIEKLITALVTSLLCVLYTLVYR